ALHLAHHAGPLPHAPRHGRLAPGLRLGHGERRDRRRPLPDPLARHALARPRHGGDDAGGTCQLARVPALGAQSRAHAAAGAGGAVSTPAEAIRLLQAGDAAAALAASRRLVESEPGNARAHLAAGLALRKLGHAAESLAALEEAAR